MAENSFGDFIPCNALLVSRIQGYKVVKRKRGIIEGLIKSMVCLLIKGFKGILAVNYSGTCFNLNPLEIGIVLLFHKRTLHFSVGSLVRKSGVFTGMIPRSLITTLYPLNVAQPSRGYFYF